MSMAFLEVAEAVSGLCGLPVINPARCALATAEAMVAMNVRQSRRTYPRFVKPVPLVAQLPVS
jgi:hypothetical protein